MRISQEDLFSHLAKKGLVKSQAEHQRDPSKDNLPAVITQSKHTEPVQAVMLNPYNRMMRGGKNVIEPNRRITYRVLRNVAEKGFLINTIIGHLCNRVRPYLKPSTNKNVRGFQIRLQDQDATPSDKDKTNMKALEKFFVNTGFDMDPEREDNLTKYTMKLVRDLLTLDQVTTEIQLKLSGKPHAFWAVDPATIYRVSELGYDGDDKIKFIQEIDTIPVAYYTHQQMIFDYRNARTDIDYHGYGYSETEQAIDLITSMINTFMFNAGFFTENRLPRGMLLLNGDADLETVEAIEDYMVSVMSNGPTSQWRVPIIPAGLTKGEAATSGKAIEWISLQQNNRDMEFSQWAEFLWSSVAALYGVDLEELGIKTSKSTSVIGSDQQGRIEESKSRGLSNLLSFLQDYYGRILSRIDERYVFEFVGYEKDDVKLKNETRESLLRSTKSIDELRAEDDLPPFNTEWSKIPMNPSVVQMVMADKQAAQMAAQGGMPGQPGAPGDDQAQEQGGFDGGPEEADYRDLMMGGGPGGQVDPRDKSGGSIYDPDALGLDDEEGQGAPEPQAEPEPEPEPAKPKKSIYQMKKAIEIIV